MTPHDSTIGRASALPLSVVLESLSSYPRPILRRLVARMIDQLNERDGDPDLEDATNAEDEGVTWEAQLREGAGCPIADPGGGAVDDEGEPDEAEGEGGYDLDQREVSHWGGSYRIE